jgi:betaine reductase
LTVTEGDPTWAGPLAGAGLNLPVYHVIEPEIKSLIDSSVYDVEVGLSEVALEDPEQIIAKVKEVRVSNGSA